MLRMAFPARYSSSRGPGTLVITAVVDAGTAGQVITNTAIVASIVTVIGVLLLALPEDLADDARAVRRVVDYLTNARADRLVPGSFPPNVAAALQGTDVDSRAEVVPRTMHHDGPDRGILRDGSGSPVERTEHVDIQRVELVRPVEHYLGHVIIDCDNYPVIHKKPLVKPAECICRYATRSRHVPGRSS